MGEEMNWKEETNYGDVECCANCMHHECPYAGYIWCNEHGEWVEPTTICDDYGDES